MAFRKIKQTIEAFGWSRQKLTTNEKFLTRQSRDWSINLQRHNLRKEKQSRKVNIVVLIVVVWPVTIGIATLLNKLLHPILNDVSKYMTMAVGTLLVYFLDRLPLRLTSFIPF